MIRFLDLNKQYLSIKNEVDLAIQNTIKNSDFIGNGHSSAKFEQNFSNYLKVDYCVGVGNGTDALEIAISCLNLDEGAEIIVPANSFVATAEAVVNNGHTLVFADVCQDTYNLDLEKLEGKITEKTKCIIAVHLYGHPCDMDGIMELANKFDIRVIEDCAQVAGGEYKGLKLGSIGDLGCYSFYPGKNLGAYGDGGAIVTSNEELAIKCRKIANHGRTAKYDHDIIGRNSRLDGMQAAILDVKLLHLDSWIETRNLIARTYLNTIESGSVVLPKVKEYAKHAFHLFVIRTDKRDTLQSFLKENDIQTGIHYPIALPKLKAFESLNLRDKKSFAELSDKKLLSLPIGDHLIVEEAEQVAKKINSFFS